MSLMSLRHLPTHEVTDTLKKATTRRVLLRQQISFLLLFLLLQLSCISPSYLFRFIISFLNIWYEPWMGERLSKCLYLHRTTQLRTKADIIPLHRPQRSIGAPRIYYNKDKGEGKDVPVLN